MGAVLSTVGSAGPYALFLGLCVALEFARQRGWIISVAEYKRTLAAHDRALEVERRIAGYHEERANREAARADRATEALAKSNAELPPALHALARSNAGAS